MAITGTACIVAGRQAALCGGVRAARALGLENPQVFSVRKRAPNVLRWDRDAMQTSRLERLVGVEEELDALDLAVAYV
jgi:hypothetical protein